MIRACRLRLLATPVRATRPLSTNGPASPLPPKPRTTGDGGGSGGSKLVLAATFASVVYVAYELESQNPAFQVINDIPYANKVLDPLRKLIRDTGLVQPEDQSIPAPKPVAAHDLKSQMAKLDELLEEKYESKPVEEPVSEPQPVEEEVHVVAEPEPEPEPVLPSVEESPSIVVAEDVAVEEVVAPEESEPVVAVQNVEAPVESPAAVEHTHVEAPKVMSQSILPDVSAEGAAHKRRVGSDMADVVGEVAKQSAFFRQELEAALLKDIHNMDAPALRTRITQLAAELFERFSWENLRISSAVKEMELEYAQRYDELMKRQRRELEFEIQRIIFDKEKEMMGASAERVEKLEAKYEEQMLSALRAQAEGFQATLQKELEAQGTRIQQDLQDQLNNRVAMLRKSHNDHLLNVQPKIAELSSSLEAFQTVVSETGSAVKDSVANHSISAVVLSLESLLSQPVSKGAQRALTSNITQLKQLCREDALVASVLDSVPQNVLTEGALTLPELQVRFHVMREEVRKAALAPENAPKMLGQIVGSVLAAISFAPKGLVAGPGTEEALARAAFHLERGQLRACLKELDGVEGYSRVLMEDWQRLASDRLVADQMLQILRANAIIRHKSFV